MGNTNGKGILFEYTVTGTTMRKGSSKKKLEKKVSAYSVAEVYNNPANFGFFKVHAVKSLR